MVGKRKHLSQRRRVAKETRDFRFAGFAPWREILHFFAPSWGEGLDFGHLI